jgi:hypothetical protein
MQAQPSDFSSVYEWSKNVRHRLGHGPTPMLLNAVYLIGLQKKSFLNPFRRSRESLEVRVDIVP